MTLHFSYLFIIKLEHFDGKKYLKSYFFHRDEIDELKYPYEKKERGRERVRINIQIFQRPLNLNFQTHISKQLLIY